MQCHINVKDEILENRPDVRLCEDLLGLVLGIDVTMIHEIDVGILELNETVLVGNDLFDVLKRQDCMTLDLSERVLAHCAADEHSDQIDVKEQLTVH